MPYTRKGSRNIATKDRKIENRAQPVPAADRQCVEWESRDAEAAFRMESGYRTQEGGG